MVDQGKTIKKHSKLKKVLKCIAVTLGIILILMVIAYINLKNFTVKRVQSEGGQDVYIMGTFHVNHFDSWANYSIEEMLNAIENIDMLNAIENIDPDVVFIEAREESYEQYGVVDGPVDD